ncbi:unnamed protein product [Brachionus calyciflorus]|uniref:Uncharacterized protein n=1 Tax=Brachionus calyciflorus TaxID=104777 RepID=A0A814Q3T1_9BILA|nr:unnamed protein product [Brachionus calyciflorus]
MFKKPIEICEFHDILVNKVDLITEKLLITKYSKNQIEQSKLKSYRDTLISKIKEIERFNLQNYKNDDSIFGYVLEIENRRSIVKNNFTIILLLTKLNLPEEVIKSLEMSDFKTTIFKNKFILNILEKLLEKNDDNFIIDLSAIEKNIEDSLVIRDSKAEYIDGNDLDFLPKLLNIVFINFENLPQLTIEYFKGSYEPFNFKYLKNLTHLILKQNQIIKLENEVLNGLENLEHLILKNNQIKLLKEKAFSSLLKLKELRLEYNRIEEIENGVFNGLFNLEVLELKYNGIKFLKGDAFNDLINLKSLTLFEKDLSEIDNYLLEGLKIEIFKFKSNQLILLEKNFFNNLTNIKELHLDDYNLSDLKNLNGLKNLEHLIFYSNGINIFKEKVFSSLINLKELRLYNNNDNILSLLLYNLSSFRLYNTQL